MKKIVIFTGAGISQESGLPTFRGEGGIWESIDAEKVADYRSWYCGRRSDCKQRRQAVLDFFNPIRRMILESEPNEALMNTSTLNPYLPFDIDPEDPDIRIGDKAPDGSQIRPYVIFFNENLDYSLCKAAITAIREADIMIVIGCSLKVFPAAGMIRQLREEASLIVIDPGETPLEINHMFSHLKMPATKGMQILEDFLKEL